MPVNGKCAMHSWTEYQQRAATPDEIRGWWTECSTAGVAIVTGQISQLDVLDVDGRLGGATLARLEAEHGRLPETAVQRTGRIGGRQLAFRHPGRPVKTRNGIAPGLDRVVALLAGKDNIREVIAFPKTQSGHDPLTGAPGEVPESQLRELGLRLLSPERPT